MDELISAYSLAGVRAASTAPQRDLIARARAMLAADERVLAAWLVGGFAAGEGDAFSDVDLQCSVDDGAAAGLSSSWPDLVAQIVPTVWVSPFPGAIGGLCITPDWQHLDIVFHPRSALDPRTVTGMVPLLDKAGLLPPGPVPRPSRTGKPFYPAAAVEMFLYMLGNMVSVLGRNEVVPGTNGVIMVRDIALVGLLLAEQGIASTREHPAGNVFPFSKRLRRYLDAEQNQLLESLPPLTTSWDSIIGSYVAMAQVFIPRARRLAGQAGAAWPAAYAQATISYFERMLGADTGLGQQNGPDL